MAKTLSRAFLTAEWRFLAMLNWGVERSVLAPYVPAGVELDDFNGTFYATVVGFLFESTRVLGLAVPFHTDFEEVNLRFYVRRRTAGGIRRGVVFVKELVPRRLIALVARRVYHEKYVAARMAHEIDFRSDESPARVVYSWTHAGEAGHVRVSTAPGLVPLAAGSIEEFLAEHYYGYVRQPDGTTREYAVEHPPWKIWPAEGAGLDADVGSLYDDRFASTLNRPPDVAFLAAGSPVVVRHGIEVPS
ncbi:MAG: DUF2071 domain-containing protein [Acidobacteriota bacterium]